MGFKLPLQPEQGPLIVSKVSSVGGLAASGWIWIGANQHQIAAICAVICTIMTVLSFKRTKNKEKQVRSQRR